MSVGPLIIVSGPSGSGKSTVIDGVMARGDLPLHRSVSVTTRPPRPGERDGEHYHFWPRARFEEELAAGGLLEWAEVYGNYYGTLRREVEPYRAEGRAVVLNIDVQGAREVRRACPEAVAVFLRASCWSAYERRLRARGTEDEAALRRRLTAAKRELDRARDYDYHVVNDDLDTAVDELHGIVRRELERSAHA